MEFPVVIGLGSIHVETSTLFRKALTVPFEGL
jgi:hypothetical protein